MSKDFTNMSFQDLKKLCQQLKYCNDRFDLELYLGNLINLDENDPKQCKFANNVLKINKYQVLLLDYLDFYVDPSDPEEWSKCPKCGERPKIWIFDNGCYASCKCANGTYSRFQISIEPVCSVLRRTGSCIEYGGENGLKNKWNDYCKGILIDKNKEM